MHISESFARDSVVADGWSDRQIEVYRLMVEARLFDNDKDIDVGQPGDEVIDDVLQMAREAAEKVRREEAEARAVSAAAAAAAVRAAIASADADAEVARNLLEAEEAAKKAARKKEKAEEKRRRQLEVQAKLMAKLGASKSEASPAGMGMQPPVPPVIQDPRPAASGSVSKPVSVILATARTLVAASS